MSETRTVGTLLTCDQGEWSGGGAATFEWRVDGEPVAETGSINPKRFLLRPGHVGRRVSCAVTKTNEHGATTVVTDPVEVVEA